MHNITDHVTAWRHTSPAWHSAIAHSPSGTEHDPGFQWRAAPTPMRVVAIAAISTLGLAVLYMLAAIGVLFVAATFADVITATTPAVLAAIAVVGTITAAVLVIYSAREISVRITHGPETTYHLARTGADGAIADARLGARQNKRDPRKWAGTALHKQIHRGNDAPARGVGQQLVEAALADLPPGHTLTVYSASPTLSRKFYEPLGFTIDRRGYRATYTKPEAS